MKPVVVPALAALALVAPAPQRPITTARELLEAMRARYERTWYRDVTFVQHNTEHRPDGSVERSVWREWLAPGKLRIEFEPADSGHGMLFTNDSQYVFRGDSAVLARAFVHPLLVLAFDVYAQPVERTIAALTRGPRGFDLSVLSEAEWEGRPVWVVGAPAGDRHRRQFWIDKERLVFVRMLQPAPQDTAKTAETRFTRYQPLAGGWIAPEVQFLFDGQLQFLEEYRDIRANTAIPDATWDARQWNAVRGARGAARN
ncbi:MAG: hypothetical protein ACREMN_11120 [Gemmatimonadales bacterium]